MLHRASWVIKGAIVVLVLAGSSLTAGGAANTRTVPVKEVEDRLRKDVTFLASDRCEGRGPTTQGIDIAADYVADQFKKIGLRPGLANSYFQPFQVPGASGTITLTGPRGQTIELKQRRHFNPLGSDQNGQAIGGLVFVGYGVSCKNPAYDDYHDIDVKDRIVVVLRDTPRAGSEDRSKEMLGAAPFIAKMTLAMRKGAAGVLFVNDAETASEGDLPMDYSYAGVAGGAKRPLAAMVRRSVLEAMLPAGRTLVEIEKAIDRDMKPSSFELKGWSAEMEIKRKKDLITLKNVVGVLDGFGAHAKETIVIGAHYDHLGYGGPSSLSRSKKAAIHHGADDNASGTSAMIELARRFAAKPERQGRRLVFIAFSGEEMGLLGSRHYCNAPLFPLTETAAMFNLDMVGRLRKDPKTGLWRLQSEGHGTAKEFKELIDVQAKKNDFTLVSQASGFGPSDHASFCGKKIPVLFFWTGTHPEYHRPTDTADRINVEGIRRVVELSENVVSFLSLMPRPTFVEVKGGLTMGRPGGGPRLGIRPMYDENATKGLEVEGVVGGGPADKAGMKNGDLIVSIAGKEVKNMNTYMQAMALQKKGTTIEVIVQRGKSKQTLKVNLE